MIQSHNFYTRKIKNWYYSDLLSFSPLHSILVYTQGKDAALIKLPSKLNVWNKERISARVSNGQNSSLSIEDISFIKNLIQEARSQTSTNCTHVFVDQLFFLTIGAIQIQSQTDSNQAWKVLSQTIGNYLNPKNEYRVYLVGIVITALVLCMSTLQITYTKHYVSKNNANELFLETPTKTINTGIADPVTISMLQLAYSKMKNGICQLPQATMLPERQRQAFLMFVNEGTIDVNNVENLREAFGYVSCLYPQELMRPLIQ